MTDSIIPDELLHRAVKPAPLFWSTKTGGVSSALFKDSFGVSVDRNADRTDDEIKESFLKLFPDLKGEARLLVKFCLENNCRVIPDPLESNLYHALILGENEIKLSPGQAKKLARGCKFVPYEQLDNT